MSQGREQQIQEVREVSFSNEEGEAFNSEIAEMKKKESLKTSRDLHVMVNC